jgi:hypothetical protein
MIPNYPCRHTALHRAAEIDWNRKGIQFELGDLEPQHEIVVSTYTGREWPLATPKGRKSSIPIHKPEERCPAMGDAEAFIDRLLKELRIAFPRTQLMPKARLCMDFGKFVGSRSLDDLEVQSRFQLQTFLRCRQLRGLGQPCAELP